LIYCQISTRISHEGAGKWRGDVLIAKPQPVYSPTEYQKALIVELDDEFLEAQFASNIEIIVHPYAEYEVDESDPENIKTTMIMRSRKYLDINSMPVDTKNAILNPDEILPMLSWSQISAYWKTRIEDRF